MMYLTDKNIKTLSDLLVSGIDLTVDKSLKKAWIFRCKPNEEQIPFWYAENVINTNLLECHSGNFETGERHYNIKRH